MVFQGWLELVPVRNSTLPGCFLTAPKRELSTTAAPSQWEGFQISNWVIQAHLPCYPPPHTVCSCPPPGSKSWLPAACWFGFDEHNKSNFNTSRVIPLGHHFMMMVVYS